MSPPAESMGLSSPGTSCVPDELYGLKLKNTMVDTTGIAWKKCTDTWAVSWPTSNDVITWTAPDKSCTRGTIQLGFKNMRTSKWKMEQMEVVWLVMSSGS